MGLDAGIFWFFVGFSLLPFALAGDCLAFGALDTCQHVHDADGMCQVALFCCGTSLGPETGSIPPSLQQICLLDFQVSVLEAY